MHPTLFINSPVRVRQYREGHTIFRNGWIKRIVWKVSDIDQRSLTRLDLLLASGHYILWVAVEGECGLQCFDLCPTLGSDQALGNSDIFFLGKEGIPQRLACAACKSVPIVNGLGDILLEDLSGALSTEVGEHLREEMKLFPSLP